MAGLEVAYLPGIAAHGAARLFAGDAKTDARDAMVIAKTALGIPDALLPVPRGDARLEAARSMAAQRNHMVTCATRDKNRLRSILLESCPPFEALADLSDPHWVRMLERLGGPWGIADAGKAAMMLGPVLYCLEGVDNGAELYDLTVDTSAAPAIAYDPCFGVNTVALPALRTDKAQFASLYRLTKPLATVPATAKFIPHFAFANRGESDMTVWFRYK